VRADNNEFVGLLDAPDFADGVVDGERSGDEIIPDFELNSGWLRIWSSR